jgi:Bifunctional DNA primase/polymerase, N-terminal/Family of unknown function (DUF5906)
MTPVILSSPIVANATIGEHALYYATSLGWPVFPAPPGEKKSHKKAEYSDGRKWGATCDPDEIRRDFEQWPDANIGIRTGAISGFWAVDIDTPEGHGKDGFASLAALEAEHGALPATLQAESPSGSIHYLFKYPAGIKIRNSVSRIAPGVDVRGDGGMVIAPPSVKPGRGTFLAYLPLNQFIYLPTRALWPATTINTTLAPVEIGTKEVKKRDSDEVEEVPVTIPASKWLNRNKGVACMTWAPGYPMIVHGKTIQRDGWVDNPGKTTFNEYREPTIKHVPGDPSPWVNHIRLLCGEHTQHVLYYFAHRVQRPAEKINHALVFGGSQGIGKDTAFEPLKAAVGPWNFKEASPVTMMSQFDPYKKCVMLRVNEARDLGDMTRHEFYERIKNLSAAPPDVLTVNEKYLGETYIPNVCGMVVTTNHQDAIALPADDRRCFVMWSTLTKEDFTEQYWTDLYAWFANGGNEIVAHYLATLDLSGFNAKAYPLRTEAWHQMVGFSAAPEDAELADAIDVLGNPDALTVAAVIVKADNIALRDYLRERRNSRSIPLRFNKCEYVPVRNKAAKDGLWVVSKKRQVVYPRGRWPTLSPCGLIDFRSGLIWIGPTLEIAQGK